MKTLTLFAIMLALAACSGPPERDYGQPRELTAEARSGCRLLGTIVKRAAGYAGQSMNTKKAMDMGLDAVREAGGDSYYLLDVDTSASVRGTRVIMEAYDCG